MKTPSEFDDIRPFESEELPEVYDRLLANEQFQQVLNFLKLKTSFALVHLLRNRLNGNIGIKKVQYLLELIVCKQSVVDFGQFF